MLSLGLAFAHRDSGLATTATFEAPTVPCPLPRLYSVNRPYVAYLLYRSSTPFCESECSLLGGCFAFSLLQALDVLATRTSQARTRITAASFTAMGITSPTPFSFSASRAAR